MRQAGRDLALSCVRRSAARQREFVQIGKVILLYIDLHRLEQAHKAIIIGDRNHQVGKPLVVQFLP